MTGFQKVPRRGRRGDPLREVVSTKPDLLGLPVETLECGHQIRPPKWKDEYTSAHRRRCPECGKAQGDQL